MYSSTIREYRKSNNIEELSSPVISDNCSRSYARAVEQAWGFWDFKGNSFCLADTVCS